MFVLVSLCLFELVAGTVYLDPREVRLLSYLVEHQCVKPQTKGHHQEQEEHHDADQGLHDLPEHHHVDTETIKPGQNQRLSNQQPARVKGDMSYHQVWV